MKLKKFAIGALLAVAVAGCAIGFAACGGGDDVDPDDGDDTNIEATDPTTPAAHIHVAGSAFYSDATDHWNLCTADGCDTEGGCVMNKEAHTEATEWTLSEDGTYEYKACTVCGYVMETQAAEAHVIAEATAAASSLVTLNGLYQESSDGTAAVKVYLSGSMLAMAGLSATVIDYSGTYVTGTDEDGDYTIFTLASTEYSSTDGSELSDDYLATIAGALVVGVDENNSIKTYTTEDTEADHSLTFTVNVAGMLNLALQFEVSSTSDPTDADAWISSLTAA